MGRKWHGPAAYQAAKTKGRTQAKAQMPMCAYGRACNRRDCVYRHPPKTKAPPPKERVCLAFVAGLCEYGSACDKRHPGEEEVLEIIASYARKPCQHGRHCHTVGCLYLHPEARPAITGVQDRVALARAVHPDHPYVQDVRHQSLSQLQSSLGAVPFVPGGGGGGGAFAAGQAAAAPVMVEPAAGGDEGLAESFAEWNGMGGAVYPPGDYPAGPLQRWEVPSYGAPCDGAEVEADTSYWDSREGAGHGGWAPVEAAPPTPTPAAFNPAAASWAQHASSGLPAAPTEASQGWAAVAARPAQATTTSSASSTAVPVWAPGKAKVPQDIWTHDLERDAAAFQIANPLERYGHVNPSPPNPVVMDLHFQSTRTFPAVLDALLEPALQSSPRGHVWVVTGTGHHTARGHGKAGSLFEGVKRYLLEYGYDFDIGVDNGGFKGAFRVKAWPS